MSLSMENPVSWFHNLYAWLEIWVDYKQYSGVDNSLQSSPRLIKGKLKPVNGDVVITYFQPGNFVNDGRC